MLRYCVGVTRRLTVRSSTATVRRLAIQPISSVLHRSFTVTKTTVVVVPSPASSTSSLPSSTSSSSTSIRRSSPPTPTTEPTRASDVDVALSLETGLGASLRHLLTAQQRVLLLEIKQHLNQTRSVLKSHAYLSKEDARWLKVAIQSSEDLFSVCVVGEFNAGKSNLLNALLGGEHCPTGVLPTTERINVMRYGQTKEIVHESENVVSVLLPLPFLQDTSFVDTPGTNAVLRSHEIVTKSFIPRADLILFLTSVDRPFSQSESMFLRSIDAWKKKIVIVLNKIDLVKKPEDQEKIVSFVKNHAKEVIKEEKDIVIFPISAEKALAAKLALAQANNDVSSPAAKEASAALAASGLPALEHFIFSTLTAQEKLFLKLNNPLGIGERILMKYLQQIEEREDTWKETDAALLEKLQQQQKEFLRTVRRDFALHQQKLQAIFTKLGAESDRFIESHLTFSNARALLFNGDSLKHAYEQEVYSSLSSDVEKVFTQGFDWFAEAVQSTSVTMQRDIRKRLSQLVSENQKQGVQNSKALQEALSEDGSFSNALTDPLTAGSLGSPASQSGSHQAFVHLQKESAGLSNSQEQGAVLEAEARSAVLHAALLQVSSLSLGTAFVLNALSIVALAAIPGYFAVGGFVTLGLAGVYALPYMRRKVSADLKSKIEKHSHALQGLFERTMAEQKDLAVRQIERQILHKYVSYVEREGSELAASRKHLGELQEQLVKLQKRIKDATGVTDAAAIGREQEVVRSIDQVTPLELLDQPTTEKEDTSTTTAASTTNKP